MLPDASPLTTALVTFAFGGGLLPSVVGANKQVLANLQPSAESTMSTGDSPPLRSARLLLYPGELDLPHAQQRRMSCTASHPAPLKPHPLPYQSRCASPT